MAARGALDRWNVLRPHVEDGVPLTVIAADSGLPVRTLERWRAAYKANGLGGLTPRPRRDEGTHRLPDELTALI